VEDPGATELTIDASLAARADALRTRYLDPDWTWRR
jgi:hypothetical protein